jgi:glycerophosphoryl diester phosphodiesterase
MHSSLVGLALLAIAIDITSALPQRIPQRRQTSGHTALEPETPKDDYYISFGPRPYFIINNMTESPLKTQLESCENGPFSISDFSIGHRGGGTLQFPEETVQSTMAGARMGAGILECDVSFTKDRGLVCRHSLCDLHSKTLKRIVVSQTNKC